MSFSDTETLERSLLKLLTNSAIICRRHMHQIEAKWFTKSSRRFIFKCIQNCFHEHNTNLTESIYKYDLGCEIEVSEHKTYLGEWNIIRNLDVSEPVDVLLDRIEEANIGKKLTDDLEIIATRLENGDIDGATEIFKKRALSIKPEKENQPIVNVFDFKHRRKLIDDKKSHPEKYAGIKTGFRTFDSRTGGLHPKELTVYAATAGLGKSTIAKQIAFGIICANPNKNVLFITNEESQIQVETKFDALITEYPYLQYKFASIEGEELENWQNKLTAFDKMPNMGKIFVKEVPQYTNVTLIEQAYRELEMQGTTVDVIIIDYLKHLMPVQKAWDLNEERAQAASDCKQLAKDLKVSVITPTQASTEVAKKQEGGKRASQYDVYGSKGVVHVANTFFMITYKGRTDFPNREDWEQDVFWLIDIKKNRDGPMFCFPVKHFVDYGKVVEVDKDFGEVGQDYFINDDDIAQQIEDIIKEVDSHNKKCEEEHIKGEEDVEEEPTESSQEEQEGNEPKTPQQPESNEVDPLRVLLDNKPNSKKEKL